jgi:hypothetical protein
MPLVEDIEQQTPAQIFQTLLHKANCHHVEQTLAARWHIENDMADVAITLVVFSWYFYTNPGG